MARHDCKLARGAMTFGEQVECLPSHYRVRSFHLQRSQSWHSCLWAQLPRRNWRRPLHQYLGHQSRSPCASMGQWHMAAHCSFHHTRSRHPRLASCPETESPVRDKWGSRRASRRSGRYCPCLPQQHKVTNCPKDSIAIPIRTPLLSRFLEG